MPFLPEDATATSSYSSLKLSACPHFKRTGYLNAHGYLRGYGEGTDRRCLRGRRAYCSNRGRKVGCGRTHSYFLAKTIPRSSLTAITLWSILFQVLSGVSRQAAHQFSSAPNSPHRIWTRCIKAQGTLRNNLCALARPPPAALVLPFLQVIRHLADAFPHSLCPISAYQVRFQTAFF